VLGGLARRAAYVLNERGAGKNVLFIDSGNLFPDMTRVKDREKAWKTADILVRAYERMGVDAVNVGLGEVSLGRSFFEGEEGEKIPWLSSNILDEEEKPLFRPYILKNVQGVRMAFIGLAGARVDSMVRRSFGSDFAAADPVDAARKVIGQLFGQADVIVLLAAMTEAEIRRTVEANPGICFVIGGEGDITGSPSWVGRVPVVYSGIEGQHAGLLELTCGSIKGDFVDQGQETRIRGEIESLEKRVAVFEKAYENKPTAAMEKMIGDLAARKKKLEQELIRVCTCELESGKFLWNLVPMSYYLPEDPEVLRWMQAEGVDVAYR